MKISMSVKIIPNKCEDCAYALPSWCWAFRVYCIKRDIFKKNNVWCKLWKSADKSLQQVQNYIRDWNVESKEEAYQDGVEHERKRLYELSKRSRGEMKDCEICNRYPAKLKIKNQWICTKCAEDLEESN